MIKEWFELNKPYHFETNDIIALLNLFSVFMVIHFGLIASWIGLAIAIICIIADIIEIRRFNIIILHLSIAVLNTYFLMIFYNIL